MHPKWKKVTRAQQDLYITLLWQDGHSEKAIADFLGTTKGIIVRRRQSHLKSLTGARPRAKQFVDPERFQDLLDLHAMDELKKKGVSSIVPPKYKMAASEATQCEHEDERGNRCGYEYEHLLASGKRVCSLHK